jgi:hypothetical protein
LFVRGNHSGHVVDHVCREMQGSEHRSILRVYSPRRLYRLQHFCSAYFLRPPVTQSTPSTSSTNHRYATPYSATTTAPCILLTHPCLPSARITFCARRHIDAQSGLDPLLQTVACYDDL